MGIVLKVNIYKYKCDKYGLTEFTDQSDFNTKLLSVKVKGESLCPWFHNWF